MPSQLTRVNVTLPTDLLVELNALVGPRQKSAFIAQALRQSLDRRKQEARRKALDEGYAANREDGTALTTEFEACDLENWGDEHATW